MYVHATFEREEHCPLSFCSFLEAFLGCCSHFSSYFTQFGMYGTAIDRPQARALFTIGCGSNNEMGDPECCEALKAMDEEDNAIDAS